MAIIDRLRRLAEGLAALMMAAMFAIFIVQVAIRYSARYEWIAEAVPLLDPSRFGWTLEFCLALWVWLVFLGNAFVVREQEHVTFDILYFAVSPAIRRWFAIVAGLAIAAGLLASVLPTWDKFYILRLKRTATLSELLGDWVRMRDIYLIYLVFLVSVSARYLWRVVDAFRNGVDEPNLTPDHHPELRRDE